MREDRELINLTKPIITFEIEDITVEALEQRLELALANMAMTQVNPPVCPVLQHCGIFF